MKRPQTSSLLRSNSSEGSNSCSKRINSTASDCTSSLSVISRRCTSTRLKIPMTGNTHSSNFPRYTTTMTPGATSVPSSSCPLLLSVLAWSVTLLLISACLGIADAGRLMGHHLSKRSYPEIICKGVYDKVIYAKLERICEDCYNLFREPSVWTLCRKDCFTSDYFKGCIDTLQMQDEEETIKEWIKQIHGADPNE